MTSCEDCGCAVYNLGCTNCNEEDYIEEQEYLTSLPEIYETQVDNISFKGDINDINKK